LNAEVDALARVSVHAGGQRPPADQPWARRAQLYSVG
jgi:hypothetical protein